MEDEKKEKTAGCSYYKNLPEQIHKISFEPLDIEDLFKLG